MSLAKIKIRALSDLESVGKETLKDFERLGVSSVAQLAKQNPKKLYEKLCDLTRSRHDICVLDTFQCAIAQARNPNLPAEQRKWWYWSQKRKAQFS
jgi:nucleotidyltransferase/DNA polymerase involved in DNA repair